MDCRVFTRCQTPLFGVLFDFFTMGEDYEKYYIPSNAQELIGTLHSHVVPQKDDQMQSDSIKQELSDLHLPPSNAAHSSLHGSNYMGAPIMGYPMHFEYPYNMENTRGNLGLPFLDYPEQVQPTLHAPLAQSLPSHRHYGQVNSNVYTNQQFPAGLQQRAPGNSSASLPHDVGHSRNLLNTTIYKNPTSAVYQQPATSVPPAGYQVHAPFNSEVELKRVASEASKIPLPQLAARVKVIDNDDLETAKNLHSISIRDKHRDIFAAAWLLGACDVSSTAVVPRNRVYARYVQSCATFGLVPITPTNMGKLVKMMFPGLSIRRLGVRGRSKYHYNGIRLVEDSDEIQRSSPSSQLSPPEYPSSVYSQNSPSETLDVGQARTPTSLVSAAELLDILELHYVPDIFNRVDQLLETEDMSIPVTLPSIYPYLPPDTDSDIADTLYALYTIHCTTVLECMRYLHTKRLFQSYSALNTILTAPVKTLYSSESVVPWIHKCDSLVYNKMAKMLTRVYLQLVPDMVLHRLKEIAEGLIRHLTDSLRNKMHKEFVDSKLKSALKFVSLLTRMIAVIQTRDNAFRYFKNPDDRRIMIESWQTVNIPEIVEHLVPCQDRTDFLSHVLVNKVSEILRCSSDIMSDCTKLIAELPSRFLGPNPRFYLVAAGSLLTACLIEIGLYGKAAKEAWYMVICWIDEFMNFCLELGGYFRKELESSTINKKHSLESCSGDNDEAERTEPVASESAQTVDLLDKSFGTDRESNFEDMFYNVEDILHETVLQ